MIVWFHCRSSSGPAKWAVARLSDCIPAMAAEMVRTSFSARPSVAPRGRPSADSRTACRARGTLCTMSSSIHDRSALMRLQTLPVT